MSMRRIIESFDAWRVSGRPLVLATVYETLGSTYSKPGHRIIIAADGNYQGLVSGGCLEGDLAERARSVIADGRALPVTYDLRGGADEVFGLGVGCDGLIRVLLQRLTAEDAYEPFATLSELMFGRDAQAATATVVESGVETIVPGATVVCAPNREPQVFGRVTLGEDMSERCLRALRTRRAELETRASGVRLLYAPLPRVPSILLLGGGLDAVPLVNMAAELGWRTTVCDHRPAYLGRGDLARADDVLEVDPRALAERIDLTGFDAALVMSHHLVTDATYLRQLAPLALRYVGVLGPRHRKERLLLSLGAAAGDLAQRLRGPVGLDIGASSPEAIALSVLAELQAVLADRSPPTDGSTAT